MVRKTNCRSRHKRGEIERNLGIPRTRRCGAMGAGRASLRTRAKHIFFFFVMQPRKRAFLARRDEITGARSTL